MKNASLLIHPDELSLTWIDRMVSHGLPTLALHPVGGREAKKSLEAPLEQLEQPSFRALIDYAVQRGLRIEYEMHAMQFLLPRSEFSHRLELLRLQSPGPGLDRRSCRRAGKKAVPQQPPLFSMAGRRQRVRLLLPGVPEDDAL